MDNALIVIVVLAVVGALVFLVSRRGKPALPEAPQAPKPAAPAVPAEARAAREPTPSAPTSPDAGTPATGPAVQAPPPAAPAPPPASAEVAEVTVAVATEDPEHASDVAALKKGLASTRGGFIARLAKLFSGRQSIDPALLEEIEEVLLTADIGVKTSDRMLSRLREQMKSGALSDEESVWRALRAMATEVLSVPAKPISLPHKPSLILIVGVNGAGKTTTIGKLASRYVAAGRKPLLAAGDTFRAAAVLQLEVWGKRVGCPVVKGKEGADPGAVIFEAIKKAQDERFDLVIADTAGRLHTKAPLMEELKKVERTIQKALGGRAPDEILLVLDATTGQNAVQQMHIFREALPLTGVVLTKLDGTAKGGMILGIVDEHKVPVRFVGLGEKVEDLREFDAASFVEALFEKPDGETVAA
jgi:fused signal recognition particle receptor